MPKKSRVVATASQPIGSSPSKRKQSSFSTLKELEVVRAAAVGDLKAKNTEKTYQGYIARGKKFLKDIVTKRQEANELICSEGISTNKLEVALDNPPNQYSAIVIEMFITQKCFSEGRKEGVATGIHAAFCRYWDEMDGERYAGPYSFDTASQKVSGCPTRAACVQAVVDAVKMKSKSKGAAATRNHAEAMSIEDMTALMQWSESVCPDEWFKHTPADTGMLKLLTEHGLMRAFASSGFILRTHNFELCTLQASDIKKCFGPPPYDIPQLKVTLEERKGWQKQAGYDGPRTSNIYNIYQQDIPEIDMYTHIQRWTTFVESQIGHCLQGTEYIFPYYAPNGLLYPERPLSYDMAQGLLAKFALEAGLKKNYTTHCFRRGGAQYRFMYAPIGKRWSLNMVRWWGGWAVGEQVDTLIKYLVNSLQSFETGHGDALCPLQNEADKSFMGDHIRVQSLTTEEFRQFTLCLGRKLHEIDEKIASGTAGTAHPNLCFSYVTSSKAATLVPNVNANINGNTHRNTHRNTPSESGQKEAIIIAPVEERSSEIIIAPVEEHSSEQQLPIPGVSIPDLGRHQDAWLRAVTQWEEVDPATGYALKDWPNKWYTGVMKPFTATKRTIRKTVADEFEKFGRDKAMFIQAYPEASGSLTGLVNAIRERNSRRRKSKRGSPSERASEDEHACSHRPSP